MSRISINIRPTATWIIIGCMTMLASPVHAQAPDTQDRTPYLATILEGHWSGDMTFSPDGIHLGIVTAYRAIVFDLTTETIVADAELPDAGCGDITDIGCAFSADGARFVAARNRDIVVLDIDSKQEVFRYTKRDKGLASLGPVAFTEDGKRIVFGGQGAGVWILDLETSAVSRSQTLKGGVVSIQRLPESDLLVIGHFNTGVDIWDAETDCIITTIPPCESFSAAVGACDDFLAVGCGGHEIRLFSPHSSYRPAGKIECPYIALCFSLACRTGLIFGGSGKVGHGADGQSTLMLYDLKTTRPLAAWPAHTSAGVHRTAIASDGSLLASMGYDGKLMIWRMPAE